MTNGEVVPPQTEETQPSEAEEGHIDVVRVRHFFEFETPFVLKRTEEVTLFNHGEEVRQIVYNAREFLPHLMVHDSDGRRLIFHGVYAEEDLSEEEPAPEDTEEGEEEEIYQIVIEFPHEHPLRTEEFRTITYTYIREVEFGKGVPIITIPLEIASHFYIYIKKLPDFNLKVGYLLRSTEDRQEVFRFDDLSEEEADAIEIQETIAYSSISSQIPIERCELLIGLRYELFSRDWYWFVGGIAIAVIALLINLILMLLNVNSYLTGIIAITGIVNSYLIVTKGWIFMKNMDKPVNFPYTNIYLALILLLFIELMAALALSIFNFSFIQNISVVIDQQIKLNATL